MEEPIMNPNEINEGQTLSDIPEEAIPEAPAASADFIPEEEIPEAPAQEASVSGEYIPEQPAQSGSTYHGAGVGQKESPYASSPYYTAKQTRQEDYTGPAWQPEQKNSYQPPYQEQSRQEQNTYQYQPPYQTQPPKQKKVRKPLSKKGKGIIAALLAVAVVAGSCGITASVVSDHWEDKLERIEDRMEDRIEQLEDRIESHPEAEVISGTTVSNGGLNPSQVYAMNVGSVVSISNYATVLGNFWGGTPGQQMMSSGSGFILTEDGYVITNYHVVEGAEKLTVTTHLGEEHEAQLVGHDELNDVALLKVEATGLDAVVIGSSDDLSVGDQVVAIGNPLGELTSTQTVGYISGKDRSVTTDGSIINMLQTDAAINSGNSGGPLFNMKGEVVGITTAKYSGSSGSGASIEGIGFAIPIDDVMGMIDDLRDYGYLKNQAYLGVEVMNMDSDTASMYSLPLGSYVSKVVEGGSAHRAGVQEKDIIIALGDYTVTGNSELTNALRRFSAGDTTTITVFRAGQELTLDITFDEKPQDLNTQSTQETMPGEMPENGSYEEWYDYFAPYFGEGNG